MLTPGAKSLLGQLVLWAGINVVYGFINPGIDNSAHLGGCAAGLLLGFILRERRRLRTGAAYPEIEA
jgi:membrane associated rhomboid family serine protease